MLFLSKFRSDSIIFVICFSQLYSFILYLSNTWHEMHQNTINNTTMNITL